MILIDPDGRAALAPAMAVGTAAGRAGAVFCAQYPALCGAIAAGVNACFRAVTGSGGGGNDNNDCKEEIRKAREICTRAYANGWRSDSDVGPYKKPAGGQWTIQDCMRGLISQRCGGNSVN